jgi:hypothetical protein
MVLAPGGRLAWFGPPDDACTYFGVRSADEIFARMTDETPVGWREHFRQSAAYRKFVSTREHLIGLDGVDQASPKTGRPVRRSFWLQYTTLTRRYALVKVRDTVGTGVLLAQAPILGVAMWVVFPKAEIATIFVLVLSVLWFGASASVRELISERTIWRREARVGLGLLPYMASKLTVLAVIVLFQAVALTGILYWGLDMGGLGYSFVELSGVSLATGMTGMAMGLLVSSIFSSSEAAVGTLPLLLIPQITFGGLIVKVKNMTWLAKVVAYTMITRYGFEAAIKTGEELSKPAHKGVGEANEPTAGALWHLGFRTSEADDMGIPMPILMGILFAFFASFMIGATWFTHRSREGN